MDKNDMVKVALTAITFFTDPKSAIAPTKYDAYTTNQERRQEINQAKADRDSRAESRNRNAPAIQYDPKTGKKR